MNFFISMPLAHQILLAVMIIVAIVGATILDQRAQIRRRKE